MIIDHLDVNIPNRKQKSILPWKGQFTPDLVDNLINAVPIRELSVLDPFCGSGTVIQSAAKYKAKSATGLDLNPAAVMLARSNNMINLSVFDRLSMIDDLEKIIFESNSELKELIISLYNDHNYRDFIGILVCLSANADSDLITSYEFKNALRKLRKIAVYIPEDHEISISVSQGDARFTGLKEDTYNLIFTSPPYINVFNYHQNHRKKLENYLGILPLQIAVSEIGSNRKFRQNRFKTVAQYVKDMYLFSLECYRVLKAEGKIILVVGKESNVLGVPFYNGNIVRDIFISSGAFAGATTMERVFTNMYGEKIQENILIFDKGKSPPNDCTREVILHHFTSAYERTEQSKHPLLDEVLEDLDNIQPSPKFCHAKNV